MAGVLSAYIYSAINQKIYVLVFNNKKSFFKRVIMLKITPKNHINSLVTVPGSKSCTHRIAIAAALSNGPCKVINPLESEDTLLTLSALNQMGVVSEKKEGHWLIFGADGTLSPCNDPIYLANSGTSMRLLTALAALGKGTYTFTGTKRMHQRPMLDLINGLNQIGVDAVSLNNNGCPPVAINAKGVKGGRIDLDCSMSSQYLSALLLIAPYTENGIEIQVTHGPVSKPYIDLTIDVLKQFGITVIRTGYQYYKVPGGQHYRSGTYAVEPDGSNAGYFWAAAAITGGRVKVKDVTRHSRQGDVRLAYILEEMGCHLKHAADGIEVTGGPLTAVEVDMSEIPDMVPTLAVVAAFAKGTTRITNVAHLRVKECDRLGVVATELSKMGAKIIDTEAGLEITGGPLTGATIETYNDHRIAMSFAVAGLVVPDVLIDGERCVEKSFPTFWEVFQKMTSGSI
jgi:3-phosphoshikimate 1-carboxyvinyltransferase